jgi:hypothetical protein
MRRYTYIIIAVLLLYSQQTFSRADSPVTSVLLANLFGRILNTNNDSEKIRLNDSVQVIIDSYAASDSVLTHKLPGIRNLGQIASPDLKVKIITWNLILREGGNKYFCYIIKKGARGETNKVCKLMGENREESPAIDRIYTEKEWYGALYYALQPFKKEKETCYLVLGIDYGNSSVTRKIIDVLTFTPDGGIVFGNNCFIKDEKPSSRVVIEYFSEGVITLRLLSPKSVVFDRLATISDDNKSGAEYLGSEYSFDGYALKKGFWRFVSNVDARNKK